MKFLKTLFDVNWLRSRYLFPSNDCDFCNYKAWSNNVDQASLNSENVVVFYIRRDTKLTDNSVVKLLEHNSKTYSKQFGF